MSKVIGIDFGTTCSRVAVVSGNNATVIEIEGQRELPSCVACTKAGEFRVGEPARRQAILNPENTIGNLKHLIGRKYKDGPMSRLKHTVPYGLIRAESGDAALVISGRAYSVQLICAMILEKLKIAAEHHVGSPISHAVMALPSSFDELQRLALKEAARQAGIEVLRFVNEPAAAALAYAMDRKEAKVIAIYDLGGGHFSISIIQIGDGLFEVQSTDGDEFVAGDAFDERIVAHLCGLFAMHRVRIDEKVALQRLKGAAETLKIQLSSSKSANVTLPMFAVEGSAPKDLTVTLGRATFETLIRDIVERTIEISRRVIANTQLRCGPNQYRAMTLGDLHEVIVIGGSTRIPLVLQEITNFFGKVPYQGLSRTHAVACGAAVQGGVITGDLKSVLLLDVVPHSLGIETLGGVFVPIIARNTTIPTKKGLMVSSSDHARTMTIRVYQGESEKADDNTLVGGFDLDLSSARGDAEVEVTIDIAADYTIHVAATEKATGKGASIHVGGQNPLDGGRTAARQVALPTLRETVPQDWSVQRKKTAVGSAPKTESGRSMGLGKKLTTMFQWRPRLLALPPALSPADSQKLSDAVRALIGNVKFLGDAIVVERAGPRSEYILPFNELHRSNPHSPELHYAYAAALAVAMQRKRAQEVLEECVARHPNFVVANLAPRCNGLVHLNPFLLPEFPKAPTKAGAVQPVQDRPG